MLARVTVELAEREISIARLLQHQNGDGAAVHVVTHEAREGSLEEALDRDRGARRGAQAAAAVPRRLRSRRRGARMGVIDRYRDRLPVGPDTPRLTLGEGSTPLIRSERLSEKLGVELWFKFEGANPTGSFKDRGMAVAVAKAVEDGYEGIVCASTGNTAASAAAYAARAGVTAVVMCPAGAIAAPKQAQARAVGARVLEVRGSFDDALRGCLELADRGAFMLVNSLNPHRHRGPEDRRVRDRRGARPRAGRARAALRRRRQHGRLRARASPRRARTHAARRRAGGRARRHLRVRDPHHRARPPEEVDALIAEGRVEIVTVGDAEITDAWLEIASREGVFCEPSSAAGFAGLAHVELEPGSTVVCVLTGHGLKDTARWTCSRRRRRWSRRAWTRSSPRSAR